MFSKKISFFLLVSFSLILCEAQNLVPNPSFESYTSCPTGNSQISKATPWNIPPGSITTPDLFNSCNTSTTGCGHVDVPNNFPGGSAAFHGNGYAGILTYYTGSNNLREYLQVQLSSPMVANTLYRVHFRVLRGKKTRYASNKLGIYISGNPVSQTVNQPIAVIPQIEEQAVIKDSLNWRLISGSYMATGGERYITIGNFNNNSSTTIYDYGSSSSTCTLASFGAYYFIDSVFVGPCPQADLIADNITICEGTCINFSDQSTGSPATWNWSFTGATPASSTEQNPLSICYNAPGIYSVSLTVADNGCSSTLVQNSYIQVLSSPAAMFSTYPSSPSTFNSTVYFNDQSAGAVSWSWAFGDQNNSLSIQQNPVFTYTGAGYYPVQLTVKNNDGCTDTLTKMVYITPDYLLYVPNTFSPNGDNLNDVFVPEGIDVVSNAYELQIFDRWGNLIFSNKDFNIGWDGRVVGSGDIAQIDTYIWKINITDIMGNELKYTGHINLIK